VRGDCRWSFVVGRSSLVVREVAGTVATDILNRQLKDLANDEPQKANDERRKTTGARLA
jgi:hypothetical protein